MDSEHKIFFYHTDPTGAVKENPDNLPAGVLAKIAKTPKASMLRVAFDPGANKVYVQDESAKRLMASGDETTWHFFNQTLKFLKAKHGVKFADKQYGEPAGHTTKRQFSNYQIAHKIVATAMANELGMKPIEIQVCERSGTGEPMGFLADGKCAGTKGKMITFDKDYYKSESEGGDPDYVKANRDLAECYLNNVPEICSDNDEFKDKWKRYVKDLGTENMIALLDSSGKTRVMKSKDADKIHDEASIRQADGMKTYDGPILMFSYDPEKKQLVLQNTMIRKVVANKTTAKMLADAQQRMSRIHGVPMDDIVVSFDPSLSQPKVISAEKIGPVWDRIVNDIAPLAGINPKDIKVLEAPIPLNGWEAGAALVASEKAEANVSPELRQYRVSHGIILEYPFIVVDTRTKSLGTQYRGVLGAYASYVRAFMNRPFSSKWLDGEFVHVGDRAKTAMLHMLRMGMSGKEVLDFFGPRPEMGQRVKNANILKSAWAEFRKDMPPVKPMGKTAAVNLNVNDWWHIGSQESLNEAEHTNDITSPKPSPATFNLKKSKETSKEPPSYEKLLADKHDKDLGFQKTTEQLLRESRV